MAVVVPPESVVVASSNNVGGAIMSAVVTGLSWVAFGFCFAGGWMLLNWLVGKMD